MPSFASRVMNSTGAKARVVDFRSAAAGFVGEVLICQNLTDVCPHDMREEGEENARELMS